MVGVYTQVAGLVWRLSRVRRGLRRDPAARDYMDQALTPVSDDDFESLEMLTGTVEARASADKSRLNARRLAERAAAN